MQAHLLIIFTQNSIKEITPIELKALIDSSVDFQLIDVREAHELAVANIGGEHIPLGVITQNAIKGTGKNTLSLVEEAQKLATQAKLEGKTYESGLVRLRYGFLQSAFRQRD
jgi:hypothetical protein